MSLSFLYVCSSCHPPPHVKICWTTLCLSVPPRLSFPPAFPKALYYPFFQGESLGSPKCLYEPCSALMFWEWVHVQLDSPLLLSFSLFLSPLFPSKLCSLYRIFVYHPHSCQPLFSLRVSITLRLDIIYSASVCGLSKMQISSSGRICVGSACLLPYVSTHVEYILQADSKLTC